MRVIVVGGGKLAFFLARDFAGKGYHVTVVTLGGVEATALSRRLKATVLQGNGSDPAVLEEAGARRADVVISLDPNDEDNLAVCQIAHRMFRVPRTVALINDPENEDFFRRMGVSVAFSATQIIARILEERAGFEEITSLIPLAEGRISVSEVILRQDAPAAGKALQELRLPEGALIGGIVRDGRPIIPRGGTDLRGGDRLILIAELEDYDGVLRLLTGEDA